MLDPNYMSYIHTHTHTQVALAHVWIMAVTESLTLAVPFAVSHNFVDADRHPVDHGKVDWYKSQVRIHVFMYIYIYIYI